MPELSLKCQPTRARCGLSSQMIAIASTVCPRQCDKVTNAARLSPDGNFQRHRRNIGNLGRQDQQSGSAPARARRRKGMSPVPARPTGNRVGTMDTALVSASWHDVPRSRLFQAPTVGTTRVGRPTRAAHSQATAAFLGKKGRRAAAGAVTSALRRNPFRLQQNQLGSVPPARPSRPVTAPQPSRW